MMIHPHICFATASNYSRVLQMFCSGLCRLEGERTELSPEFIPGEGPITMVLCLKMDLVLEYKNGINAIHF
jgi:hypothetical protein